MADKAAPVAPLATPEEVKALQQEQETEYGTWVALAPITYGGVLAYIPGDPVPVSNVARFKYDEQGLVAKATTKAATDLVAQIHATTQTNDVVEPLPAVTLGVTVPETK